MISLCLQATILWHIPNILEILKLIIIDWVNSTYSLWVTRWLRQKKLQNEGQKIRQQSYLKYFRKKDSINLAAVSGCLLLFCWRPGLKPLTESVLLREVMRQQTGHDSMLCKEWHTPFLSTNLKHHNNVNKSHLQESNERHCSLLIFPTPHHLPRNMKINFQTVMQVEIWKRQLGCKVYSLLSFPTFLFQ